MCSSFFGDNCCEIFSVLIETIHNYFGAQNDETTIYIQLTWLYFNIIYLPNWSGFKITQITKTSLQELYLAVPIDFRKYNYIYIIQNN